VDIGTLPINRFARLRIVIVHNEQVIQQIFKEVVVCFDAGDIDAIGQLMEQKNQLQKMNQNLNAFIEKWELLAIDYQGNSTRGIETTA
jgi:ABC-type lipopolysaccharide export system ATPase subunit